ncbi:MAG: tRNA-(ms[2]io[6]A)-hydroxylase [Bacteroidia bacterium]|nr:tRNA-(ms[2]io[6]A)-hydroxylase [Bacteroidia bacterium]
MKYEVQLKCVSSKEWLNTVMNDFPSFMQDHADCERKASAMAMSFVAKYPDRKEILKDCIATGIEELEHFNDVYRIMEKRGIPLKSEIPKDMYMHQLLKHCRSGREDRFLDRLIVASIVESRGAERFKMIADSLEDEEIKKFYYDLGTSEARHCHIFIKMARNYFDDHEIENRIEFLSKMEAEILMGLELKPALH